MLVLDASAIVELLLGTPAGRIVDARLRAETDGVHAPEFLDLEVLHALRRLERRGLLSAKAAAQAVVDLIDLSIGRERHAPLLPRVWQLRDNATAYDASYLALAEALQATLVTADRKMTGVPGVEVTVALV